MKLLHLKFIGIELFMSYAFKIRISCQPSPFPQSRSLSSVVLWIGGIKTNQFMI